jgi:hypothetical protein
MTPEGRIKAKFNRGLAKLKEKHGKKLWVRMPVSRGMGMPWLDYHLCTHGRTIAVEAKRDADHDLTGQQKMTKRELEAAGAYVFVVYDDRSIAHTLEMIDKIVDTPWIVLS